MRDGRAARSEVSKGVEMSYTPQGQPPQGQPPYGSQPPYGGPPMGLQPQEDNDKILAAVSYIISPLMSIIILVTDMKNKPFLKYHAYQSLVFGIALIIGWTLASFLAVFIVGCLLMPVLLVAQFYYAYLAYTKGIFTIPLVTDLTSKFFSDFPTNQNTPGAY
jgi:uncharacterized membrane protein